MKEKREVHEKKLNKVKKVEKRTKIQEVTKNDKMKCRLGSARLGQASNGKGPAPRRA